MKKRILRKKVNLGSGKDYLEGWINVDVEEKYKVDFIADLGKRFPFRDDEIEELKASDILEHFTKEDGERFLYECYRVLQPNGIITIRTHNVQQIVDQFENDPEVMMHFLYGDTSETGIFGAHKFGYTEGLLRKVLRKIGFEIVSFEKETTNFLVIAKKKKEHTIAKLNIGIIMQSPDIGGAEMYMLSLIDQFLLKGHTVHVASNKEKFLDHAAKRPIRTYIIPVILDIIGNTRGLIKSMLFLPYVFIFYLRLLLHFKKQKVNVLLMSGFSEKMLVTALSPLFGIAVVWIEYGRLETVFKRNFLLPKMIYRILKGIPESVIVPSDNTRQSLITEAHVSLAKIHLIPCGIPLGTRVAHAKEKLFPEWKDALIVGNVSRATREKGQQYLIHAIPKVHKALPNARFVIIGEGPDKEYFIKLIQELQIERLVKVTGFVHNLSEHYSAIDIFVFPTVWEMEGFGLVVPEAMSYGIPVIASRKGPVPEIVDHEKTGMLVPSGDANALANTIIAVAKDGDLRKELAKNGKKKANTFYDIKKVSDRISTVLYDAVI